jgi:hypothetical protein
VANNPSAWVRAIRERVNDLDALAREGDGLRDWVRAGWILEDRLDSWMAVLSCDSGAQDAAVPKSIRTG